VRKISPTQFEVRHTNFTPTSDVAVLILQSRPRRNVLAPAPRSGGGGAARSAVTEGRFDAVPTPERDQGR
jgi:hypothetical protein